MRDRLAERRAQAVERRALHLVLGAARIDDLAADVADDPDMIELDVAGGRDGRLHHLGEIAEVAEVEGDALAGALRQGVALRPARNLGDAPQHIAHAAGVEIAQRIRLAAGIDQHLRLAEQRETELHRVRAGRRARVRR